MKVAFSIWNKRIAPVFDTSVEALVLEVEGEDIKSETEIEMCHPAVAEKILLLQNAGIQVLVCGSK